jgi:phosphoribosyl 1,2-cyclic phosphodiesterase
MGLDTHSDFFVRFWGVRGSIACPGASTARYGGNTSCLEVRCGDRLLIFDGGTGMRSLGLHLDKGGSVDADVYFTHTHVDHIQGLPFFSSAYKKSNRFRFWAGHLKPEYTLKQVLSEMMMEPLFPVPISIFGADISFHDFDAGQTLLPGANVTLRTAPLNHPNRATGYRVEYNGKSICYVTDTEHIPGKPDRNVLELISRADIVIYDSTYTDDEYGKFAGWGHSTWQEAVRLCEEAKVGRAVIFHHDPSHDDSFMDRIAEAADKARPGTIVAHEGLTLSP